MPAIFRRESQMTEVAVAASKRWWGARREPDFTAAEIVGPDAIADLAAARFDHDRLQRRLAAGIRPVTDALALRVLLASRRRAMSAADLACACRVSPSGIRRAISIAIEQGALTKVGGTQYKAHNDWGPATARMVAIELKLQDWTTALSQAYAYSSWANASWAILARMPSPAAVSAANADGVGLAVLSPSGEITPLARPAPRRRPSHPLAAIWAGEQVISRAESAGFSLASANDSARALRAMPQDAVGVSLP